MPSLSNTTPGLETATMKSLLLLSRNTLRTKLVVASLFCILVPMLVILIASQYFTKDILRTNVENNAFQSLQITNESVRAIFKNMIYVANFVQFDSEMNSLLREQLDSPQEIQNYEQYSDQVKLTRTLETLSFSGEPLYISIVLPNGKTFTNYASQNYHPNRLVSEPWFLEIKDDLFANGPWLGVHANYLNNTPKSPFLVSVVRSLKLTTGSKEAYIFVSINESRLHSIWGEENKGQEIMLTDQQGNILSHLNPKRIGQQVAGFPDHDEQKYSRLIEMNQVEYVMASMDTSFNSWKVVSLTSYKQAVSSISDISQTIIVMLLVFFTIFLLILIILIRQFTKPIVHLSGIVRQINEGNLEIRSQVRGSDEIGFLGRAIDNMLDRIQDMIEKIIYEQNLARKAEIDMLQAQINPHFLFNILNSIRMRILINGDKENARIIESLSTVLRMTIDRNNAYITLQEEVEVICKYVELFNFRRSQMIRLQIELDPGTVMKEVPRFIIQPLIENACLYGVKQNKGTITITSLLVDTTLVIIVADDGEGIEQSMLADLNQKLKGPSPSMSSQSKNQLNGIGLANVAERIRIIYGPHASMKLESELGQGTRIILKLPIHRREANNHV